MSMLRHALLGATVLASCGMLASPAYAQQAAAVEQRSVEFDIPAQDLGSALNELARQAGITIAFPVETVSGRAAPAVRGRFIVATTWRIAPCGGARSSGSSGTRTRPRPTPSSPGGTTRVLGRRGSGTSLQRTMRRSRGRRGWIACPGRELFEHLGLAAGNELPAQLLYSR